MVSISVPTHREPPFYGPAGLWCWIDNAYRAERIGLKYGIFWMVALINICLYVPLFWSLRRDGQNQISQSTTTSGGESVSIASKMLVYPIAYIFLVLPMSIIRWIEFTRPNVHVGTGWIALAGITFGSSGLVNSLLYIITRPGLLPSFHKKDECTCCGNSVALRDVESGDPNRRIGLDDDD
ncbi:hypothetical protein FRC02_001642 [Tulasnella sp. 418]|nr:hypothetical protein FRC02_001642 [Tulasnella sp. 418]